MIIYNIKKSRKINLGKKGQVTVRTGTTVINNKAVRKYFNNLLGLYVRLSHFVANQQYGCTSCSLNNVAIIPDNTLCHLFYDCETTRSWHANFLREHIPVDFFYQ
jgi:hypothetical protein